jgi:glutamyl-tRNA synthetase
MSTTPFPAQASAHDPGPGNLPVRVRIAPSPTGFLHVGTARTALFNYLFAKRHGGTFLLRIEDTDLERSEPQYIDNIYEGLRGLGLHWDEGPDCGGPVGPYCQSQRLAIYAHWAQQLLAAGLAYRCYKTPAELDTEREAAMAAGRAYTYVRPTEEETQRMAQDPQRSSVLRFRIPDNRGDIVFQDLIRGEIRFDAALLGGDFVLMKSNGTPSYNFAVVIDDWLMNITHVIRGEDHIPNTPRQVLLYEALATLAPVALPCFAHVGMILAPDRSKLSKRHGATAVSDYLAQGYLPEAFCNFLALLGWSPPDGEEVGTLPHFAQQFSLERITHGPAVFDQEKLNWLNGLAIRRLPMETLAERSRPFLQGIDAATLEDDTLARMVEAVREPLTTLGELPEALQYFFGNDVDIAQDAREAALATSEAAEVLAAFEAEFLEAGHAYETALAAPSTDYEAQVAAMATVVKAFVQARKPVKVRTVMMALRVALTGQTHGADLSKVLVLLGKGVVQHRIRAAMAGTCLLQHP